MVMSERGNRYASISVYNHTKKMIPTCGNIIKQEAEFNWSASEKGTILSSFAWGYFSTPFGIIFVRKFGGVQVFGVGVALTGSLTIFTPILVRWNLTAYLIARIFEGIFEGLATTCLVDIFVRWAPPMERSRLISLGVLGIPFGTMISNPICGSIAYHYDWAAIFYVTGGIFIIWYVVWLIMVKDSPVVDKLMSPVEKKYLIDVNHHIMEEKITHYPWKEIFTSKPVWAYFNCRFVESWSLSFLTYCIPLYIKDIHDVDIQNIGLLSGIPHIGAVFGLLTASFLADYFKSRQILSATNIHKLYLTLAQSSAVVLLAFIAFWRNIIASIVFLFIFRIFYSLTMVCYGTIPIDLGGRYGSFIFGMSTLLTNSGYVLNPIIMGIMVSNHSVEEWSRYFILICITNLWGAIIWFTCGSGDLQPWALTGSKETRNENAENAK